RARELRAEGVIVERIRLARRLQPVPDIAKSDRAGLDTVASERMDEAVSCVPPAIELDAELDRAIRGAHHFERIEREGLEVTLDRREGGSADADRANRRSLDQGDADAQLAEPVQQ